MLQQIAVPLIGLLVLFVSPHVPQSQIEAGTAGQVADALSSVAESCTAGAILGFAVVRLCPWARLTGRWIAAIPVVFVLLAVIYDGSLFSFQVSIREMFFPGPDGENALGFIFLTCPTISAVGYSGSMIGFGESEVEQEASGVKQ